MTERVGQMYYSRCHEAVDETCRLKLASIMNFNSYIRFKRLLELIVIDFLHGVKG